MLDSCFLNRIHVRYPFLGLSKFLGDRLVFRRKRLLHEAMKYICVGGTLTTSMHCAKAILKSGAADI